jgi:hypothetical protein
VANTLAYYDTATITAVKSFIVQAPGRPVGHRSQGSIDIVHFRFRFQVRRQKEIRDLMKKKREKAVLVDRISRWLFPTRCRSYKTFFNADKEAR